MVGIAKTGYQMSENMNCTICGANSRIFSNAVLLRKYTVSYYRCENCGFVRTEEPYWLNEAYSDVINRCDVGLVSRNIDLYNKATAVLLTIFNPDGKFVDYGGGYGLLVRLMRDAGFDFYRYDKHCENIFAQDFEAEFDSQFELLTAFEVFEHLVNPLEEIEQMFSLSKNILFTTEILPIDCPKPYEWWYYIPEYGQHISFFTMKSLSVIADKYSLNLYSDGKFFHLLTEKRIPPFLFKFVSRMRISSAIKAFSRRKSLIPDDYRRITGKVFL